MEKDIWSYTDDELKEMKEQDLIKILNDMTNVVYEKDFYQVFDCDMLTIDDQINDYNILKTKYQVKFGISDVGVDTEPGDRNFMDIWSEIWNARIIGQDIPCTLYGLCAISQIFDNDISTERGTGDDIRIHLCMIMPTASGKSEGNNMLIDFCRLVGITYALPEEFSPATLIGTVNKSIIDSNIAAKAFTKDHEDWRDPEQIGILGTKDFLIFDEGENILHTTPRTEGAQRILQHAMNRHGSATNVVTNELVNGKIEVFPNCNIVITSYYMNQFKETLLNRGLLQRMIIYFRAENDINRNVIRDFIYDSMVEIKEGESIEDGMQKIKTKKEREEELAEELKREVSKLRARHANTKFLVLQEGTKDRFKFHTHQLQKIVPNMTPYQRNIWESMISRIAPTFIKLSAIYALMNYRVEIVPKDADNAAKLLMETMQSIAFFMLSKIPANTKTEGYVPVYNKLKHNYKNKKFDDSEWLNIMVTTFGVSLNNAKKLIEDLKANGKLVARIDINSGERKNELV